MRRRRSSPKRPWRSGRSAAWRIRAEQGLWARPQIHDGSASREPLPRAGLGDRPSPQRHDESAPRHILDRLTLALSESGLALACEKLGDGGSRRPLDHRVRVNKIAPEALGHESADLGFSSTHHPDQPDRSHGREV